MRMNEYIPVKDENAETGNKEERDLSQTQDQKAALQSIKAKAKQKRVMSRDALRQLRKDSQDIRNNND
jgi:hypothetical protein